MIAVCYAGAMLTSGDLEGVEGRLLDAERWLTPTTERSHMPHPADGCRGRPSAWPSSRLVAVYRAAIALFGARRRHDRDRTAVDGHGRRRRPPRPRRGRRPVGTGLVGQRRPRFRAPLVADCLAGLRLAATSPTRRLRGRPGGHSHSPGSSPRCDARVPADVAAGISPGRPGAARRGQHVRQHERSRCERGELAATKQFLLEGQEFVNHFGLPRESLRRVAMAESFKVKVTSTPASLHSMTPSTFASAILPRRASRRRVSGATAGSAGRCERRARLGARAGLRHGRRLDYLRSSIASHWPALCWPSTPRDRGDRSIHRANGLLARLLAAAEAGDRTAASSRFWCCSRSGINFRATAGPGWWPWTRTGPRRAGRLSADLPR